MGRSGINLQRCNDRRTVCGLTVQRHGPAGTVLRSHAMDLPDTSFRNIPLSEHVGADALRRQPRGPVGPDPGGRGPHRTARILTWTRSCLNQARAGPRLIFDFGGSRPVEGSTWDPPALVCSGAGLHQSRLLHPNRPSQTAELPT